MYAKHLKPYIAPASSSILESYWKINHSGVDTLIVVDEKEEYFGLCTILSFNKFSHHERAELSKVHTREICRRESDFCINSDDTVYQQASYIFSLYPDIQTLPVIDKGKNIVDVITKKQVFYNDFYKNNKLQRMEYAKCMNRSVQLARKLKYDTISVIEFGVAGGNGLVNCEFHAKELERLYGVNIDIYGFDSGEGLPDDYDVRNAPYLWYSGKFKMDIQRLQDRLTKSKLVLGDIKNTSKTFFEEYSPAPIGVFIVDVDYYTTTVHILRMLNEDHKFFLPRIFAYFDDIEHNVDVIGESLAVREFNAANENIKISPEGSIAKLKTIHRLRHPDYSKPTSGLIDGTHQFHLSI